MKKAGWCVLLTMLLGAATAHAGGVDSLRDTAREAKARGDLSQAVADLRRARMSSLAEASDADLLREVREIELVWLRGLASQETAVSEEAVARILALSEEAERVQNTAAVDALQRLAEDKLLALLERKKSVDEAATLALLMRWHETLPRSSRLGSLLASKQKDTSSAIDRFAARGVDGDFVRGTLQYAYRLRDTAPSDPHPVEARATASMPWNNGSCGALERVQKKMMVGTGTPIDVVVTSATCAERNAIRTATREVRWSEMVDVPRTERVVETKTVTVPVERTRPNCITKRSNDYHSGVQLSVSRVETTCVPEPYVDYEERVVETERFVQHVDRVNKQFTATVPTRLRDNTLSATLRVRVQVDANPMEIELTDVVSYQDEAYEHAKGGRATFDATPRKRLDELLVPRIERALREQMRVASHRDRAAKLRAELPSLVDADARERALAELYALERDPDAELLQRVSDRTGLSRAHIARGLANGRIAVDAPIVAARPFWTLPRPNPDAERDAFEAEDRQRLAERGVDKSVQAFAGGGAMFRSSVPYPYASASLRLEMAPNFSLYRWYALSGFVDAGGHAGQLLHGRAAVGVAPGVHLGPLLLTAQGLAGLDGHGRFDTEDDPVGPNEPQVKTAFGAGYGARAVLRVGEVRAMLGATRTHRFISDLRYRNVLEGWVTLGGIVALGARYETYKDPFASTPQAAPWSLTASIGIVWMLQTVEAGELTGKKQDE